MWRRAEAPEERGLSRQWLFLTIEATEADARTVRIATFALAAVVALYTIHQETMTTLHAEAPPFFPAERAASSMARARMPLRHPP